MPTAEATAAMAALKAFGITPTTDTFTALRASITTLLNNRCFQSVQYIVGECGGTDGTVAPGDGTADFMTWLDALISGDPVRATVLLSYAVYVTKSNPDLAIHALADLFYTDQTQVPPVDLAHFIGAMENWWDTDGMSAAISRLGGAGTYRSITAARTGPFDTDQKRRGVAIYKAIDASDGAVEDDDPTFGRDYLMANDDWDSGVCPGPTPVDPGPLLPINILPGPLLPINILPGPDPGGGLLPINILPGKVVPVPPVPRHHGGGGGGGGGGGRTRARTTTGKDGG